MNLRNLVVGSTAAVLAMGWLASAHAQDVREFSFGYDQPKTTGYGFAGDLFEDTLGELSGGTMKVNQFPGAQLGQEPVMLQKVRSGDIDFVITSSANGATVSPELGVMSLHFLFEDEDHLATAVASPELNGAVKELVEDTVDGAHVLTLMTLGFRNIYSQGGGHQRRGPRRQEDPRPGDQDRGHALPGLRRPAGAHAVRRGLHLAPDRRGRHGRERRQRLPLEQALRGGAGDVVHPARGQQQPALGQRQDLAEPVRRAEGAGSSRRPPRSASRSRRTRSSSSRNRPRS